MPSLMRIVHGNAVGKSLQRDPPHHCIAISGEAIYTLAGELAVIIRLQNLPWSANAVDIRRFFAGRSIPEGGVHIVGGEDGDAFIAFSSDEDARLAMRLDSQQINGVRVRLYLSSKSEMQSVITAAREVASSKPEVKSNVSQNLGAAAHPVESSQSAASLSIHLNRDYLNMEPSTVSPLSNFSQRSSVTNPPHVQQHSREYSSTSANPVADYETSDHWSNYEGHNHYQKSDSHQSVNYTSSYYPESQRFSQPPQNYSPQKNHSVKSPMSQHSTYIGDNNSYQTQSNASSKYRPEQHFPSKHSEYDQALNFPPHYDVKSRQEVSQQYDNRLDVNPVTKVSHHANQFYNSNEDKRLFEDRDKLGSGVQSIYGNEHNRYSSKQSDISEAKGRLYEHEGSQSQSRVVSEFGDIPSNPRTQNDRDGYYNEDQRFYEKSWDSRYPNHKEQYMSQDRSLSMRDEGIFPDREDHDNGRDEFQQRSGNQVSGVLRDQYTRRNRDEHPNQSYHEVNRSGFGGSGEEPFSRQERGHFDERNREQYLEHNREQPLQSRYQHSEPNRDRYTESNRNPHYDFDPSRQSDQNSDRRMSQNPGLVQNPNTGPPNRSQFPSRSMNPDTYQDFSEFPSENPNSETSQKSDRFRDPTLNTFPSERSLPNDGRYPPTNINLETPQSISRLPGEQSRRIPAQNPNQFPPHARNQIPLQHPSQQSRPELPSAKRYEQLSDQQSERSQYPENIRSSSSRENYDQYHGQRDRFSDRDPPSSDKKPDWFVERQSAQYDTSCMQPNHGQFKENNAGRDRVQNFQRNADRSDLLSDHKESQYVQDFDDFRKGYNQNDVFGPVDFPPQGPVREDMNERSMTRSFQTENRSRAMNQNDISSPSFEPNSKSQDENKGGYGHERGSAIDFSQLPPWLREDSNVPEQRRSQLRNDGSNQPTRRNFHSQPPTSIPDQRRPQFRNDGLSQPMRSDYTTHPPRNIPDQIRPQFRSDEPNQSMRSDYPGQHLRNMPDQRRPPFRNDEQSQPVRTDYPRQPPRNMPDQMRPQFQNDEPNQPAHPDYPRQPQRNMPDEVRPQFRNDEPNRPLRPDYQGQPPRNMSDQMRPQFRNDGQNQPMRSGYSCQSPRNMSDQGRSQLQNDRSSQSMRPDYHGHPSRSGTDQRRQQFRSEEANPSSLSNSRAETPKTSPDKMGTQFPVESSANIPDGKQLEFQNQRPDQPIIENQPPVQGSGGSVGDRSSRRPGRPSQGLLRTPPIQNQINKSGRKALLEAPTDHDMRRPDQTATGKGDKTYGEPDQKRICMEKSSSQESMHRTSTINQFEAPIKNANIKPSIYVRLTNCEIFWSPRQLFYVLRNVRIGKPAGFRFEVDDIGRRTGSIFVKLASIDQFDIVMKYNGIPVHEGRLKLVIEPCSIEEFYSVKESAEARPPHVSQLSAPVYYRDMCVEISGLPTFYKREDLMKLFPDAQLDDDDVRIETDKANGDCSGKGYIICKYRESFESILSKNGQLVYQNQNPFKIMAISKCQLAIFWHKHLSGANDHDSRQRSFGRNDYDSRRDRDNTNDRSTSDRYDGRDRHGDRDRRDRDHRSSRDRENDRRDRDRDRSSTRNDDDRDHDSHRRERKSHASESNSKRIETGDSNSPQKTSSQRSSSHNTEQEPKTHSSSSSSTNTNQSISPQKSVAQESDSCNDNRITTYGCELKNIPKNATVSDIAVFIGRQRSDITDIHYTPNQNVAIVTTEDEKTCKNWCDKDGKKINLSVIRVKSLTSAELKSRLANNKEVESDRSRNISPIRPPSNNDSEKKVSPTAQKDHVDASDAEKTPVRLKIGNLPMTATVSKLEEFFQGAKYIPGSIILRISAQGKPLGEGIIDIQGSVEVDRVIREFQGRKLGGRPISLRR